MMVEHRRFEGILEAHDRVRNHLRHWDAALTQATSGSYGQCQHAIQVLREVCRYLEQEIPSHMREEETILYPTVEYRLPHVRALVGELRSEHDQFRGAFEEFRRELLHFNASGELRHLPRLGQEVVRILRHHLDREERELHPILLREFREQDWTELEGNWAGSQVA
jgi:hemerythrin-like domain-containing protein